MFLNDFMFGLLVLCGGMLLAAIPAHFAAKAVGNFLREKYKEGEAQDGRASNPSN